MVLSWKRLFQPVNCMQSTCLLVEMHNTYSLFKKVGHPWGRTYLKYYFPCPEQAVKDNDVKKLGPHSQCSLKGITVPIWNVEFCRKTFKLNSCIMSYHQQFLPWASTLNPTYFNAYFESSPLQVWSNTYIDGSRAVCHNIWCNLMF